MKKGIFSEMTKVAFEKIAKKKMPHFAEQDRPAKSKEIYTAIKGKPGEMKKRYGSNWKEVAARIAGRQGKPGKQKQGPPYKGPINK